jgi:hypothetical protein
MFKQIKVLTGLLVAGVAALTLVTGEVVAQDSKQSDCCCKKMGGMSMPMPMPK